MAADDAADEVDEADVVVERTAGEGVSAAAVSAIIKLCYTVVRVYIRRRALEDPH